jgi:Zn-dependent protease with chaperone function
VTPRIISFAQIGLSAVFLVGYFVVLILFVTGNIKTPPEWKEALIALLGVITGGIGTILAFWFARAREKEG